MGHGTVNDAYRFYNLTIRATNMASVSATSTAIIHVLDRNDEAPFFMQQLYKGEILESAPIASLILAVNDTLKMEQRYVSLLFSQFTMLCATNAVAFR